VLSIVARLAPERFDKTWRLLDSLTIEWQSSKRVHERAMLLSKQLKHHFFDTLYHAIAIEHGATLITADDAYFAKAFRLENMQLLTNFRAS
jgi:predicted nucleic acid-binding protein